MLHAGKHTCGGGAHGEPAGLCGCDVDAIGQGCDDQPGTVAKVLVPTRHHASIETSFRTWLLADMVMPNVQNCTSHALEGVFGSMVTQHTLVITVQVLHLMRSLC